MRRRESGRAAVIVAAVLAVVGVIAVGAGAAWYSWSSPSGPDFMSSALRMAPESSQVFLAMDGTRVGLTEETQQEALAAIRQAKGFAAVQKEAQEKLGLDLEGDILAAIEPRLLFFIAPEEGGGSFLRGIDEAGPPSFRLGLVLGLRDQAKAEKALGAIEAKAGASYTTEDHVGVKLHVPSAAGKAPVWAIHEGFLMVGAAPADLKLLIDGARGSGRSLGDSSRYQAAVQKVTHKDAMVVYADLQSVLAGELLEKIEHEEARRLSSSLRYLVGGMSLVDKELVSEGQLVVDRQAGGVLAASIFKPEYGIEMKSLAMVPAETEMFFALNLEMIWQMAYDVMGSTPEGRMMREAPAMQLAQQEVDLQKEILDALTGEIAVSLPNYSDLAAAQLRGLGKDSSPAAAMTAVQKLQAVILLPLARKESIEALLEKPSIAPALSMLATEEYKGTSIRSQPGIASFAIHESTLVLGVQDGGAGVRQVIDGPGSTTLASHPGRARLLALLGGSSPVLVSYTDTAKVYGNVAKALESKEPGTEMLVKIMGRLGSTWQAAAIRDDGIYFCAVTTDLRL